MQSGLSYDGETADFALLSCLLGFTELTRRKLLLFELCFMHPCTIDKRQWPFLHAEFYQNVVNGCTFSQNQY